MIHNAKKVSYKINNEILELIDNLKNTYGIEVSISSEYLEDRYSNVYKDIKEMRHILGIKHLMYYLAVKQLKELDHIKAPEIIYPDEYLAMDVHTVRNLELFETVRLKDRTYSLLWLLDKCKTALGSRMLKSFIISPLSNVNKIEERLRIVDGFTSAFIAREEVINLLKDVYDLERLIARLCYGSSNGRDLLQLKRSLSILPKLKETLKDSGEMDLFVLSSQIKDFSEITNLIEDSISEDAPLTVKEGGVIKDGYSKELDEYRYISKNGKEFISKIEQEERDRTGIKSLKVGYNKVFGYYFEVTNSFKNMVPDDYIRKQTLANAERYTTPKLKEMEDTILGAEEKTFFEPYTMVSYGDVDIAYIGISEKWHCYIRDSFYACCYKVKQAICNTLPVYAV